MTVAIWIVLLKLVFADGTIDEFYPAFQSEYECNHFVEHVQEWIVAEGTTLSETPECIEATIVPAQQGNRQPKDSI